MVKFKLISIILVLLFFGLGGFLTYHLLTKGLLDYSFLGFSIFNWFFILLDLVMIFVIAYDIVKIRTNKQKHGELKFVLKRKNRNVQVGGFILLLIVLLFRICIILFIQQEASFSDLSMVFLMAMLPFMIFYHNLEKEGIGEYCIYHWGVPIKWDKVISYNIANGVLEFNISRKIMGITDEQNIPFSLGETGELDIKDFLSNKVKQA